MTAAVQQAARVIAEGGFNTGRLYTAEGQRIYWWQLEDGWLLFKDISRMTHGWIQRGGPLFDAGRNPSPNWLMTTYDRGQFETWVPEHSEFFYAARVPDGFDFGPGLRI